MAEHRQEQQPLVNSDLEVGKGASGAETSGETSIDGVIEDADKAGFLSQWRNNNRNAQDIELLDFLVGRLSFHTEKIGDANGVHHNLQRLCKVVRELMNVDGLHFDILLCFEGELATVNGLGPFPTHGELSDFLEKTDLVMSEGSSDLEFLSPRHFGWKWWDARIQKSDNEENEEFVSKYQDATKRILMARLQNLGREFKKFPVCSWFLGNLQCAIHENSNFVVCTKGFELQYPGMTMLSWMQLGDLAKRTVQQACMTDEEWMRTTFSPIEEVQAELMPKFLFKLIKLKAKLQAQVGNVQRAQAKLLAAAAAGGVAVSNFAVTYFLEQWREGNIPLPYAVQPQ